MTMPPEPEKQPQHEAVKQEGGAPHTEMVLPCAGKLDQPDRRGHGGMLSAADLREIIVTTDVDRYMQLFKRREWELLEKEFPGKGLVIDEYNELNLTPFSYDLSIGDELFSVQRPEEGLFVFDPDKPEKGKACYNLAPGETVVVITRELVAISMHYSATIWPRFHMVRQGIFQSMVKIDPTWYGRLAVAMSNFSPATLELRRGQAFATLLLYELSTPSVVDLWHFDEIQEQFLELSLPEGISEKRVQDLLGAAKKPELLKFCSVVGNKLRVIGIKRSHIDVLKKASQELVWTRFLDEQVAAGWAQHTRKIGGKDTKRRMICMEALGMAGLADILRGASEGKRVHPEDIVGQECKPEELVSAAQHYGEPFDLIAMIPRSVIATVERDVGPRIAAQIESSLQPRIIALMFSVLGFLSVIIAVIGLVIRFGAVDTVQQLVMTPTVFWVIVVVAVLVVVAVSVLAFARSRAHQPFDVQESKALRQAFNKVRTKARELESKLEELEKRCRRLTKLLDKRPK